MSEPIPESIPTSSDRRSHRPLKKRSTASPSSQQSNQIDALFANPDREIRIPSTTDIANRDRNRLAAPPEIVANVQGSSAGAGSGEFHVYKASRRREYERLRVMDEEVEREKADREFAERREEMRAKDAEKLGKNQARRAKMKERKEKAKAEAKNGAMEVDEAGGKSESNGASAPLKRKFAPAKVAVPVGKDEAGESNESAEAADLSTTENGGITFHDDD